MFFPKVKQLQCIGISRYSCHFFLRNPNDENQELMPDTDNDYYCNSITGEIYDINRLMNMYVIDFLNPSFMDGYILIVQDGF